MLCEQVIINLHTKRPSPINNFTGMAVDGFPSEPKRLSVFAMLTDAEGNGSASIEVSRLDTGEIILTEYYPVRFPSRLTVVNLHIRTNVMSFPEPGLFEFALFVDNELIEMRTLTVYERPL